MQQQGQRRYIPEKELAERRGAWFREARLEAGFGSQEDFTYWLRSQKKIRFSAGQWSNYETGRHWPSRANLAKIERIFGPAPMELISGIEDKGRDIRSLVSSAA
jgi:hypothetical protein